MLQQLAALVQWHNRDCDPRIGLQLFKASGPTGLFIGTFIKRHSVVTNSDQSSSHMTIKHKLLFRLPKYWHIMNGRFLNSF